MPLKEAGRLEHFFTEFVLVLFKLTRWRYVVLESGN